MRYLKGILFFASTLILPLTSICIILHLLNKSGQILHSDGAMGLAILFIMLWIINGEISRGIIEFFE